MKLNTFLLCLFLLNGSISSFAFESKWSNSETNLLKIEKSLVAPTLTNFSPTSACFNSSATVIITGTEFTGATSVTFNGVAAVYTVNSDTQITATLPNTATTGLITIVTPTGTISSGSNFTVTSLPVVTSPASLCLGTTTTITPTSGGTWISNNPAVATITNAGVITPVSPGSVTFTFTNTLTGCSATTNPRTVNTLPVAPNVPFSNGPQCVSTGVTLSRNGSPAGGTNWYWQTTPTGTNSANFAPTWTVFASGIYYIRSLSLATGCWSAATSINVTITPPPSIILFSAPTTSNQNTCLNSPITTITYTVSNVTGATVSGLPLGVTGSFSAGTFTISGNPTAIGTFNYTLTTIGGCGPNATASGTINVIALPVVTSPVAVCAGSTGTVTPSAGGIWISSNPSVATITNAGVITGVSAGNATFTFTNTLTGCSSTTNSVTVNSLPAPPNVPLSNGPQCASIGVTLTRNGSPAGGTNWYWQTTPTGTSSANFATTWTVFTSGTYYIRTLNVTTGCWGPATSIDVIVNPIPTVTNPLIYNICNNTNANIPLTATTPSNFVWVAASNPNVGGESTTNQTSSTISNILTNTTNTFQTVVYTVTPTSTTGACLGVPQTISVIVNPTATVNAIANQTYCNGVTATLPSFNSPQTPATNVTYSWTSSINVGFGTSGAGDIPTFTATNTGTTVLTSTVTVTPSYNGCPGTPRIFTVTVRPTPTVNPVANQVRCRGTNTAAVTFTSPVAGTSFPWTNNNTAIGLAGSGTGNIASFTTQNTGNTPLVATITVTPTANGCPGTPLQFTITVNPTPTVNAIANITNICNGSSTPAVNFAGNNIAGVVYNWTNNTPSIGLAASGSGDIDPFTATNMGTGIVTATITVTPTANGCPGTSRTFTIQVRPSPIVAAVVSRVHCHNQGTLTGITFSNNIGGGGSTSYAWTSTDNVGFGLSGSGNIPNYNPQNLTNAPIVATVSVVCTRNGCVGPPTTFTVTVNPRPTVDVISNQNICNDEATAAITFTSPVAGTTFSWTSSGANIGAPNTGTGNFPSFTAVNGGTANLVRTFTVTPTFAGCVGATRTFTITVRPTPIVNVIANQTRCHDQGTTGTGVTFGNNIPGGGTTSYAWTSTVDIGFGLNGVGNIPDYNPQNPGTTPITTTVNVLVDRNGCNSSPRTFTITVNPKPTLTLLADYCVVAGKVQLVASSNIPGTTWTWSSTPATTSTIDVDLAGIYVVTGTVNGCSNTASIDIAQELVVNGAFTDGNTGFFTDYMYLADIPFVNNELIPDTGTRGYGVGTNANNYHPNFWGIDHTNNVVGPRNMMIVNGKGGSLTLWQQTVTVKPNTEYYFSGWGMSVNPASPASLRFEVNGVQVGFTAALGAAPTNATQAAANNYWIRFYSTPSWNSGPISGPITIRIVNLNPALGGNDFAIDDISFGTLSTFVNLTSTVGTDNQDLCRNTPINDITYSVGSGIAGPTITGLPPGVNSDWNGVTLRLSGSPTAAGTYNYTITTTGSCLPATATGTIIVQPSPEEPTVVTVTQPTCLIPTGTITVTSINGIYYSIDGVNYSNVSGVFTGLAPGTYNITTRNNDNSCTSLELTVVIVPQVINIWDGTAWSNGTPIITDTVVFNGSYNQNIDFQGCNCTVNSGDVVIPAGNTVTITNWVRVLGGSLTFENNSSLVQINNVANTGNITYKRDATNIQGQDYIYWSSPVTNQNLNTIYTTPAQGQKYIWNTTVNNGNGTGGNIGQGNWEAVDNVIMQSARGYIVRGSNNFTMPATTINSTFFGVPRNGNITTSVQRGQYQGPNYIGLNGTQITNLDDNFNLIGNPYPSAINALQFLSDNSSSILGNVRLWTHGTDVSNATSSPFYGTFAYNYTAADYLIVNFTGNTNPNSSDLIKTGQAFFVQMIDGPGNAVASVNFNNGQRNSNYANDNFFRVSAANLTDFNTIFTPERHRIWLDIVNSNNASTSTLVGYVAGATLDVDSNFDAHDKPSGDMRIFSSIADKTFAIQGRSLPFNQNDEVPLVVVIPSTGIYNIAIKAVDGLFENSSQNIYLEDTMLGTIHDLKLNPYNFSSTVGTFTSRFVLRYTNQTLNLPTFETNDNVFAYTDENVWVKSLENSIKDVVVYDLLGKKVDQYNNVNANEVKLENLMPRKVVYILRITLENDVIVNKKIIF